MSQHRDDADSGLNVDGPTTGIADFVGPEPTSCEAERPARAVGYIRVSHAREEMVSPEIQEERIVSHCARRGYVYVGSVAGLNRSGRSFRHRERIHEAMAMIAEGEADVIVVWKWSRFGRNARESYINLGLIETELGGSVESATEGSDTKSPMGNVQRGFFLQLAEFESDRIGATATAR
jgi:DNA invertase Pin-like site-specific DNA recombinase